MAERIKIKEFTKRMFSQLIIDVRSPSEFNQGHIPGAINIPLFDDSERKVVGTLYTKKGQKGAVQKGFEIIAQKFTWLSETINTNISGEEVLVYCWRGGMRSGAMSWLMEKFKARTILLEGGYKSYRRFIRNYFSNSFNLNVVGGMTGTGKTEILKELRRKGHQVIDLEAIAHHKGSAFGSLGENSQPTTEQFENDLLFAFLQLDSKKTIWIENESQSIGRVFLPPELFIQMKESVLFNIEIPFAKRVERLVNDYSCYNDKDLLDCIYKIRKKIGGQHLNEAAKALERKNYSKFAGIALRYYDKTYHYGLKSRATKNVVTIKSITDDARANAALVEESFYNFHVY